MRNFINIIFLSILMSTFFGCQKASKNIDSTKIEGKWKLIGQNTGLPDGYVEVKNGEEFIFETNGTFKKGNGNCSEGNYSISENHIILDYTCEEKNDMLEEGIHDWAFDMENGVLRISTTFLQCDEGCYYDYKKVSDD